MFSFWIKLCTIWCSFNWPLYCNKTTHSPDHSPTHSFTSWWHGAKVTFDPLRHRPGAILYSKVGPRKVILRSLMAANTGFQWYLSKAPFTQSCHLRATFERPEKKVIRTPSGHQIQEIMFLCNCYSTTHVPSWTTKNWCSGTTCHARKRVEAEPLPWLPKSPNGGRVVATVIAQWTLLIDQRRQNSGTREPEVSLKLINIVYTSTHFLQGDQWPTGVANGDTCAFHLPPLGDLWATNFLGALCATILNMLKTLRRPWRPWRGLDILWATLERHRQLFGFL